MNSFNSAWKLVASFVVMTSFAEAGPFAGLASVKPSFPSGDGFFTDIIRRVDPNNFPPPPILSTPEVTYRYETRYRKEAYQQSVKICEPGKPCRYEMRTYYKSVPYQVKVPVASSQYVLPAEAQPTPMDAVNRMLAALNVRGQRLVDFGCGHDARFSISAVGYYGATSAVGIEIDPRRAASAKRFSDFNGAAGKVQIIQGDATVIDVEGDVGVAYLYPETLAKLVPRIKKLKRFASYMHQVPGLEGQVKYGDFYLWTAPKAVTVPPGHASQPLALRRYAVWGGRQYTGWLCNNRNCGMCWGPNGIASQLGWR